ncbi:hypothetical protein [Medusavirus stheno T3]|uniref:Uncharacterized protein n=1 Tax=Medusavirus stheno T3 TaxID=3069717 RepID=A0A7S7YEF6_9VIRU|nr:hypothetical protein QKU73_gp059 [Acanthamoeba castellanii medusavirus]QPB44240.1 hypothetical protein [Medusavirus stheno T3]
MDNETAGNAGSLPTRRPPIGVWMTVVLVVAIGLGVEIVRRSMINL